MKKLLVLLAMMLGTANMYAQDYDLQGIGRTLNSIIPDDDEWGMFHDGMYNFCEGLSMISIGNKYCFIDKNGKLAIPFKQYDDCSGFCEGLAWVVKDGKGGFIDKQGNTAIPLIYDNNYSYFQDGIAIVSKNGKYGLIDKSGRTVIPFEWEYKPSYSEGLIACCKRINGKLLHGYIDRNGNEVIPFIYEEVNDFSDGVARVKIIPSGFDKAGHFQRNEVFIDKSGKKLSLPEGSYPFKEGLCRYAYNTAGKGYYDLNPWNWKYGFIDKTGKIIIQPIFTEVSDFCEGLAAVLKNGKYGFVDKTGKLVVPCIYDKVEDFSDGLAKVAFDFAGCEGNSRVWGYIDKIGKVVIPFDITEDFHPGDFSEGLARCGKGFIDKNGNTSSNIRIEKIAWFVCKPQRELEEANIIKSNRLNPESSWDREIFSINKISELDEIPLYSTEARLMTTHPSNSYELVKDEDGSLIIKIKDPQSFWSSSTYLVVIQSGDINSGW